MAIRTRHSLMLAVVCLIAAGVVSAQSTVPVAPVRWSSAGAEPVLRYVVSDEGTTIVVLKSSDTTIVTLDPVTGEERLRMRGSRSPYGLEVSRDGLRCMVTEFTVDDSTEMSRLYDMYSGQLVWERQEKAGVMALSTTLQRGLVYVTTTTPFFTTRHELRDLITGDSIRTFPDAPYAAFIDDRHQRIYLAATNWHGVEGAQGGWIVELDAFTGEELRSWQPSTYGPVCRLADSDSLLVCGLDTQRPGTMKIIAIDMNSGRERDVLSCATATDEYGCMRVGYLPRWSFTGQDGRQAYLHNAVSSVLPSPLVVVFDGQCVPTARILLQSDNITWESIRPTGFYAHVVDYVHQQFYYAPEGDQFARRPLICHPVGFTVGVQDDRERLASMRLYVDGGTLRAVLPEGVTADGTIDVMDMQGRLVRQVRTERMDRSVDVALDGLANGAYLCSFAAGERRSLGRFNVIR